MVLSGQAVLIPSFGLRQTGKILSYGRFVQRTWYRVLKEKQITEEPIYLYLVGVHPDHQGKGIGSALIRPVLRHADNVGRAVMLETHTEKNISIYENLGFEIVHQEAFPDDAPMTTMMLRHPQAINR